MELYAELRAENALLLQRLRRRSRVGLLRQMSVAQELDMLQQRQLEQRHRQLTIDTSLNSHR